MNIISVLRSVRIGGYALFDFAITFLVMYFVAPYLTKLFRKVNLEIPRVSWMFFAVPLGILVHLLGGINTPLTKYAISPGNYLLKGVILALLIAGFAKVKVIGKK